eukprot:CAMPEP_0168282016 /NCGR_PEP_ID=MMETSP0141_2-20121125/22086_1 /TAXON_ID=44445 /ORGANISM="Pseudo-nitzschia australis, Strain 10249 10 AB" /LENGTH=94 /DNA_ID=CAMNT_0008225601 /DNA_START=37 /DNA_END=321 /DNA_ORIENTATION=+
MALRSGFRNGTIGIGSLPLHCTALPNTNNYDNSRTQHTWSGHTTIAVPTHEEFGNLHPVRDGALRKRTPTSRTQSNRPPATTSTTNHTTEITGV